MTANSSSQKPLRLGMVGGGNGAYIGNIHRIAARQDRAWTLVAGAFDVDAARGHAFAVSEGLDPTRSYDDFKAMIAGAERAEPSRAFRPWLEAAIGSCLAVRPELGILDVEHLDPLVVVIDEFQIVERLQHSAVLSTHLATTGGTPEILPAFHYRRSGPPKTNKTAAIGAAMSSAVGWNSHQLSRTTARASRHRPAGWYRSHSLSPERRGIGPRYPGHQEYPIVPSGCVRKSGRCAPGHSEAPACYRWPCSRALLH
jgi:hypothetical protein